MFKKTMFITTVENQSTMTTNRLHFKEMALHIVHIILVLFLTIDVGFSEYENTWNFYYEQPCCSNSNGHHLRHHKGKYSLRLLYIFDSEIRDGTSNVSVMHYIDSRSIFDHITISKTRIHQFSTKSEQLKNLSTRQTFWVVFGSIKQYRI